MLHSVVLAMTLIVSLIPWQAAAQDATSLRGGVVKIMSTDREGMHRTGTGFVVKVEGKSVYIVTAEHVVEGDPNPRVEFFYSTEHTGERSDSPTESPLRFGSGEGRAAPATHGAGARNLCDA